MAKRILKDVSWYLDPSATETGAPGIWNTFVSCLCAALVAKGEAVDPVQVMGDSAWAFRILAHEALCPSAMSVFDWTAVLTESIEQVGYHCEYVARYWHEDAAEEERRLAAQAQIIAAIDRGDPAIVWDVPPVPEWGLIVGYDTDARIYHTLGVDQEAATITFDELGKRAIPILSVTTLGEPNGRTQAKRRLNALCLAIQHGRHGEWLERPVYQDGPEAFDTWAAAVESGAVAEEGEDFSQYYAGHYVGARAYAVAYLERFPETSEHLRQAISAYAKVAEFLGKVYAKTTPKGYGDDTTLRRDMADLIRRAGQHERQAIAHLEGHLAPQQE